MTYTMDSFAVLQAEHGTTVSRRPPGGNSNGSDDQTGILALWVQDNVQREYGQQGQRTERTGVLTVLVTTDYAWGEQWLINSELWQVAHAPFTDSDLRYLNLKRDDKVSSTTSRSHIL